MGDRKGTDVRGECKALPRALCRGCAWNGDGWGLKQCPNLSSTARSTARRWKASKLTTG